MSIDTSAKIMIGLPRTEVDEELLDSDDLEVASPHYDGCGENYAIAGFTLHGSGSYRADEIVWDQEKVDTLKAEFKALTGKDAKVWITPNIF
jgi:hypothetical protein